MTSDGRDPLSNTALDEGLLQARARTREVTDLELGWSGKEGLTEAEVGLLRYGVGRGWITCLEYLKENGLIELR